jgi:hypothetical protein
MPILFGFLFAFFAKVLSSQIFIKLAILSGLGVIFGVFTASMLAMFSDLTMPALHPQVIEGFKILPERTSLYFSIIIAAYLAKWVFSSAGAGLKALR